MPEKHGIKVPDEGTKDILQHLVTGYGVGQHYLKSKWVSDGLDESLSPKEVGSRIDRLPEVLDGISIEEWGGTGAATWKVSVDESAVDTWTNIGGVEGVVIDAGAFDGDENEEESSDQLIDEIGPSNDQSVVGLVTDEVDCELQEKTVEWIADTGLDGLRNTTLGQFTQNRGDDGLPMEEVFRVLLAADSIAEEHMGVGEGCETEGVHVE